MGNSGGRGQKRAAKVRSRRARLAQEETRRERHARLVVERSGDPRFVQRVTHDDGSATVSWETGTPQDRLFTEAVELQKEAFRVKFGREPGPEDPLMFDPDADTPTFLTGPRMTAHIDELVDDVTARGGDVAFVKTWRDLGYIVTTDTEHLFSAAEVQAWLSTYAAHRNHADGPPPDPADGDEFGDVDEFDDADEVGLDELADSVDAMLRDAVGRTIADRSTEPGREAGGTVIAGELAWLEHQASAPAPDTAAEGEGDGGGAVLLSLAFSVLAGWLIALREASPASSDAAGQAVGWVQAELGADAADAARRAAGLLGAEDQPALTVQELLDELQEEFVPALVWLTAGALVAVGDGDPANLPTLGHTADQDDQDDEENENDDEATGPV